MKRILCWVMLVLVCGAAGWLGHRYGSLWGIPGASPICPVCATGGSSAKTAAGNAEQKGVVGMGRIEPADGVIDVGGVMGDRVAKILVEEGATVEKGTPLADMESRALRKLELAAAAGQLKQAEARLAAETNLADVKIAAAKLGVKKAEAAGLTLSAQENKIELLSVGLALAHERPGTARKTLEGSGFRPGTRTPGAAGAAGGIRVGVGPGDDGSAHADESSDAGGREPRSGRRRSRQGTTGADHPHRVASRPAGIGRGPVPAD